MDLAVYISELLGLQGEVNVPEVGYFAQIRTNGFYNKDENKFYPPGHDISFQPQFTDDDSLARYISTKKNISLASSKYFINKYVNEVKMHAALQKVDIAGLGYLHTVNSTLAFNPGKTSRENDPAFYGFQPIKIHRVSEQPTESDSPPTVETEVMEQAKPVIEHIPVKEALEEILTDKAVDIPTVVTEEDNIQVEPEYIDDEIVPNRFANIWVVILLIITIVGLALVGIYQYYPSIFDRFMSSKQVPVVKPAVTQPTAQPAIKQDTIAKASTTTPVPNKIQSPANTQVANTSADSSKLAHYEILGGAFVKLSEAEKVVDNYHKMGFDARVLSNVRGKLHKISLGTFYNQNDAGTAEKKILSTKKISKKTIYVQFYKAKK